MNIFKNNKYGQKLLNDQLINSYVFTDIELEYNPYRNCKKIPKDIYDFMKMENSEEVFIFSGFDKLLDFVAWDDRLLHKTTKKLSKTTKDSIYQFVSLLYTRGHDYVKIHSDVLRHINKKKIKYIISGLEQGTDKGAIIEIDHSYKAGEYPKGYRLKQKYKTRRLRLHKYNRPRPKYKIDNPFMKLENIKNNFMGRSLLDSYKNTELPSIETIESHAKKLKNSTAKNRIYIDELEYCRDNKIDIEDFEEHIKKKYPKKKIVCLIRDINWYKIQYLKGFRVPTISKEFYRVTDTITLLPHWIRDCVKMDGEEVGECDFVALHPNLFKNICKERMCEEEYERYEKVFTGDIYRKMEDASGISKDIIKKSFLEYCNIEDYKMQRFIDLDKYISEEFPTFHKVFWDLKNGNAEWGEEHKGSSKFLFRNEVKLMEICMKRLHKENITCCQIYDAVLIPKSRTEEVAKIMDTVCLELSLNTFVKYN